MRKSFSICKFFERGFADVGDAFEFSYKDKLTFFSYSFYGVEFALKQVFTVESAEIGYGEAVCFVSEVDKQLQSEGVLGHYDRFVSVREKNQFFFFCQGRERYFYARLLHRLYCVTQLSFPAVDNYEVGFCSEIEIAVFDAGKASEYDLFHTGEIVCSLNGFYPETAVAFRILCSVGKYNHACDFICPAYITYVVAFNAPGHTLERKRFHKMQHCACCGVEIAFHFSLIFIEENCGVILSHERKLTFQSSLRRGYGYLSACLFREIVGEYFGVGQRYIEDDVFRVEIGRRIKLSKKSGQILFFVQTRVFCNVGVAAEQTSAPYSQLSDSRTFPVAVNGENVGVQIGGSVDKSLFVELIQNMELLLVLKRFFVVFLFACFEHFLCYHLSCFGVAAGQEFSYTGNYFSVVRFGDPSLAGRGTPPDIGIQTRSEICRQFVQVKTARARRKSFKYLENVSHAHPDYRSEIPGTVFY